MLMGKDCVVSSLYQVSHFCREWQNGATYQHTSSGEYLQYLWTDFEGCFAKSSLGEVVNCCSRKRWILERRDQVLRPNRLTVFSLSLIFSASKLSIRPFTLLLRFFSCRFCHSISSVTSWSTLDINIRDQLRLLYFDRFLPFQVKRDVQWQRQRNKSWLAVEKYIFIWSSLYLQRLSGTQQIKTSQKYTIWFFFIFRGDQKKHSNKYDVIIT